MTQAVAAPSDGEPLGYMCLHCRRLAREVRRVDRDDGDGDNNNGGSSRDDDGGDAQTQRARDAPALQCVYCGSPLVERVMNDAQLRDLLSFLGDDDDEEEEEEEQEEEQEEEEEEEEDEDNDDDDDDGEQHVHVQFTSGTLPPEVQRQFEQHLQRQQQQQQRDGSGSGSSSAPGQPEVMLFVNVAAQNAMHMGGGVDDDVPHDLPPACQHFTPDEVLSLMQPLPLSTHNDSTNSNDSSSNNSSDEAAVRHCAVCLDALDASRAARQLYCRHAFHVDCLREWFVRGSYTCPTCRRAVIWE